jgi:hypothetical protein
MNIDFFAVEFLTIPFLWEVFIDIKKEHRDYIFRGPDIRKEQTHFFSDTWNSSFLFYLVLANN